ncbi:MAG: hypothetical protein ACJATO_001449 [Arenicella sp.]|jgi:uncharacterized protein (DUF2235 family)
MSKNIVIFSDGTGQEGGKGPDTNVYKLFKAVKNRTPEQIVFYDRGLGTGWQKLLGNLAGVGISKNIQDCYRFIFENYEAGDKIYLFGFSRGAATVRSLSGFIHTFGVLPKSRPELIKRAYKIYKISNPQKREIAAEAFSKSHHPMWTKIKFVGVWDTVAALGLPLPILSSVLNKVPFCKHKFHDYRLSESIETAYHALSIDDERKSFHPTFWDETIAKGQTMEQVWFCGAHTDVGGGYKHDSLSNITLKWMAEKAINNGLLLHSKNILSLPLDVNGHLHNSRKPPFKKFFRKEVRNWPEFDALGVRRGAPNIHPSVLKRTINSENKAEPSYNPWII